MRQLSAETRIRFGEKSPYFIPETFLYKQKTGITPHICQVAALSEVTGYRFADCMKVCGFDLGLILMLQLKVPNERTTIVTAGHLAVSNSSLQRRNCAAQEGRYRYCYAKIGRHDAVLCPKLRPGSIVRADRFFCSHILKNPSACEYLWLVEHPAGLSCCHVKAVSNDQVVLLPNRPPLSPWPLRLSTQARILGLVDGEVSSIQAEQFNPMNNEFGLELLPMPWSCKERRNLSQLLRTSRLRTGLTFREVHKMTLRVARFMHNRDFGISAGLLSDYEAMNRFPRHIAKIISLCVIYGIGLGEMLHAGGIHVDEVGKHPLFTDERLCAGQQTDVSGLGVQ